MTDDRPEMEGHDPVGALIRLAGREPAPSAEAAARVEAAVRGAWRRELAAARRRRWSLALAMAASIAALAGAVAWATGRLPLGRDAATVATVEAVAGPGQDAGPGAALAPGLGISAGSALQTAADERIALRLAGGGPSVRLDAATRVTLVSAAVLELHGGAVYVDARAGETPLEVRTPMGVARDRGTQFEVRLVPGATRVRVREGIVDVARGGGSYRAQAGEELALGAAGPPARRRIPLHGPEWDWVLAIAPPFAIEGASLDAFLAWVARETGRAVTFDDRTAARNARSITLHGTLEGLTPEQALAAVLPTVGLGVRQLDADTLRIEAVER